MPFVWQDQLFMVHSVFPQRVFRCVHAAKLWGAINPAAMLSTLGGVQEVLLLCFHSLQRYGCFV